MHSHLLYTHLEEAFMSTYVLIHGAWHGSWCWYKIVPRLERAGHSVLAPDLPSLGSSQRPTNWRLI